MNNVDPFPYLPNNPSKAKPYLSDVKFKPQGVLEHIKAFFGYDLEPSFEDPPGVCLSHHWRGIHRLYEEIENSPLTVQEAQSRINNVLGPKVRSKLGKWKRERASKQVEVDGINLDYADERVEATYQQMERVCQWMGKNYLFNVIHNALSDQIDTKYVTGEMVTSAGMKKGGAAILMLAVAGGIFYNTRYRVRKNPNQDRWSAD